MSRCILGCRLTPCYWSWGWWCDNSVKHHHQASAAVMMLIKTQDWKKGKWWRSKLKMILWDVTQAEIKHLMKQDCDFRGPEHVVTVGALLCPRLVSAVSISCICLNTQVRSGPYWTTGKSSRRFPTETDPTGRVCGVVHWKRSLM